MLKNIVNLKGAEALNSAEKKAIHGGDALCYGGCAGKNEGDPCYTSTGACRTRIIGTCTNFGGQLGCKPD